MTQIEQLTNESLISISKETNSTSISPDSKVRDLVKEMIGDMYIDSHFLVYLAAFRSQLLIEMTKRFESLGN